MSEQGWYPDPDPSGPGQRWWDGYQWTNLTWPPDGTSSNGYSMGAAICGVVACVLGVTPFFEVLVLFLAAGGVTLGILARRARQKGWWLGLGLSIAAILAASYWLATLQFSTS